MVTVLGIAGSVIAGLSLMDLDEIYGILVILFGSLFSWLGSLAMYGFGELVENSTILANEVKAKHAAPQAPVYQPAYQPVQQPPQAPAKVNCPKCGMPQTVGTKFCAGCGTPLN